MRRHRSSFRFITSVFTSFRVPRVCICRNFFCCCLITNILTLRLIPCVRVISLFHFWLNTSVFALWLVPFIHIVWDLSGFWLLAFILASLSIKEVCKLRSRWWNIAFKLAVFEIPVICVTRLFCWLNANILTSFLIPGVSARRLGFYFRFQTSEFT